VFRITARVRRKARRPRGGRRMGARASTPSRDVALRVMEPSWNEGTFIYFFGPEDISLVEQAYGLRFEEDAAGVPLEAIDGVLHMVTTKPRVPWHRHYGAQYALHGVRFCAPEVSASVWYLVPKRMGVCLRRTLEGFSDREAMLVVGYTRPAVNLMFISVEHLLRLRPIRRPAEGPFVQDDGRRGRADTP